MRIEFEIVGFLALLYVLALLFISAGTAILVDQRNSNSVNPNLLKALPICNYLLLGGLGTLILVVAFAAFVFNRYAGLRNEFGWSKWRNVFWTLIGILIVWVLSNLVTNAVFYDQVQSPLAIDASLKDFVFVANIITASVCVIILAPAGLGSIAI